MDTNERVATLVEPQLTDRGLELYDVEHTGGTLRVTVDHPDGVDLDTLAELTRELSVVLDEADPVPGRYTLEVSSPGLERRLRHPKHFIRAVGTEVTIRTTEGEGDRRVEGAIEAADERGVTVDGRTLTYDEIEKARTVFRWGPAPKPGAGRAKKKKGASRS